MMAKTLPTTTLFLLSLLAAATLSAQGGGFVAWWQAEGNALDSVGENHGTLMNSASFGEGSAGQGFLLDGSFAYVAVPDSTDFDLVEEITVALWMRYEACNHSFGWCSLVSKSERGWVSSFHFGVGLERNSGRMSMFLGDGGAICFEYAGPDLRDGLWHHLAATYDEATVRYFVDGEEVHSFSCEVPLTPNLEDLEIGAESGETGSHAAFTGGIDDVMIFDYALSAPEIEVLATLLFQDGFETGNTAAWAAIEP